MGGRIILGLDPGSLVMGFGIVQEQSQIGQLHLLGYGVFHLKKYKIHMERMQHIYNHMLVLLDKYTPHEVAIESIFYGVNVQAMIKLGRAQGVAIAAALAYGLPIIEYAPCRVKQAVSGRGTASKAQVAAMISQRLGIAMHSSLLDASDALAVAVCHSQQRLTSHVKIKRWTQFASAYPHRIITPVPSNRES